MTDSMARKDPSIDAWAAAWLADRLAATYIMPSWQRCHGCGRMSREACAACWLEEARARFTPAGTEGAGGAEAADAAAE